MGNHQGAQKERERSFGPFQGILAQQELQHLLGRIDDAVENYRKVLAPDDVRHQIDDGDHDKERVVRELEICTCLLRQSELYRRFEKDTLAYTNVARENRVDRPECDRFATNTECIGGGSVYDSTDSDDNLGLKWKFMERVTSVHVNDRHFWSGICVAECESTKDNSVLLLRAIRPICRGCASRFGGANGCRNRLYVVGTKVYAAEFMVRRMSPPDENGRSNLLISRASGLQQILLHASDGHLERSFVPGSEGGVQRYVLDDRLNFATLRVLEVILRGDFFLDSKMGKPIVGAHLLLIGCAVLMHVIQFCVTSTESGLDPVVAEFVALWHNK